jgi:hypothetical protein
MSDIVKKYQHYFSESVKLQEVVNEQAAYIEELEEAVTTLSEIFDSPEGKEALSRYTIKARESLNKAREDRKQAEGDADAVLYTSRGGIAAGARKRDADEAEMIEKRNKREGGPTIQVAQLQAQKAFDTIQKRKAGLKLAGKRQEKIDAEHDARMDAEAKAKGINRSHAQIRDERGFLVHNPYYKHKEIDPEDIPPDFKLPTKK